MTTFILYSNFHHAYSRKLVSFESDKIFIKDQTKPWFCYPAIEFLDSIELRGLSVFEWGSGNSTEYFDSRGCLTYSVDHIEDWTRQLSKKVKGSVVLENTEEGYVTSLIRTNQLWDIVLIDGERRRDCAKTFLNYIEDHNPKLLIFDNSNWFPSTCKMLTEATGWLPIRFNGFGPIGNYPWQTFFLINPRWQVTPIHESIPLGSKSFTHQDDYGKP